MPLSPKIHNHDRRSLSPRPATLQDLQLYTAYIIMSVTIYFIATMAALLLVGLRI